MASLNVSLLEFMRFMQGKSLVVKWPPDELHTIQFTLRPPNMATASYIIERPDATAAFVSDALHVGRTPDGNHLRLSWPVSSGRRTMYPFCVFVPLNKSSLMTGQTKVRANLNSCNGTSWEELAHLEAPATIEANAE